MPLAESIRNVQSRWQAIPAPAAMLYDAIAARVLRKPERRIADDVAQHIRSGTVLDLGSGTGYLAIQIAARAPGLHVHGIDLSQAMVRIARRHAKGAANPRFHLGDAADIPFEDDSVDFIVSTGSLHHWKNPAAVFDECHRVLKSGGEAWIYDGCPDALKCQADRVMREYGFWVYRVLAIVTRMHGFARREYEGRIRAILDRTGFQHGCRMELTGMWMKITLKKGS